MKLIMFFLGLIILMLGGRTAGISILPIPAADAQMEKARSFQLDIDGSQKGVDISPILFGAFFEDINYAADGGLYAELVQNRSFEFAAPTQFWTVIWKGKGAAGTLTTGAAASLNANNPHYARITVTGTTRESEFGIANSGFGGIPVVSGADYDFSVYARSFNYLGSLQIRIEGANGKIHAQARIPALNGTWQKYACPLHSNNTDDDARLVVTANAPGTIDMDMVSLFPVKTWKNRPGGLRQDLVQLLADLKPKFLRFPGGCVVEGNQLADAYHWKNSLGDVAERTLNHNLWGMNQPYPYNQTYGLGFYEFFQLCEDIGAKPLPLVNAGMACQVRNGDVPPGTDPRIVCPIPELATSDYVQDAIDLLEFANGPAGSEWGAKRAALGHPEPFHLKYLGIGNENWGLEYQARYDIFRAQILARSPYAKSIRFIVCSGTEPSGPVFDDTWHWAKAKPGYVDLVDEHFYRDPEWFYQQVNRYDSYDRSGPKVFTGEYAAHEYRRRNIMMSALAEAAFMTGLVRNADIVAMASYAPLFCNVNYPQWLPDLIFFDNTRSYVTPNYYVQKLFSTNTGTSTLAATLKDGTTNKPVQSPLYTVVSKDEKSGAIIIIMTNTAGQDHPVKIRIRSAKVGPIGTATVLTSGDLTSGNSFAHPRKVSPVTVNVKVNPSFNYRFKKYSLTVLRIPKK